MVPAIVEKSRGLDRRDLEASDDVSLLGKRGCNSWLDLSRTRRELDRESRVGHGLHTREENARGPWTTSATRSVLDRAWHLLLFSAAGFLAPQLADCEPLDPRIGDDCVCGLFLFLSLPLFLYFSPSISLATQTRRCCANLTRFRWLSVSSSIAETDDGGETGRRVLAEMALPELLQV